jgi:cytidine deaminase
MTLSEDDVQALLAEARTAAEASYNRYSHFAVGAAVRTDTGDIVHGCNIENASYGLTICAERTALFATIAHRRGLPIALAVTCPDGDPAVPESLMPCGACRQVMFELLAPGSLVIVDQVGSFTLDELFPRGFRLL